MLTIDNLMPELEIQYSRMVEDRINVGLVGYIGGTPSELGDFFAEHFGCDCVNLASTGIVKDPNFFWRASSLFRKGVSKLPYCNEPILRAGAEVYKWISGNMNRTFPETIPLEVINYHQESPILLVDDNSFTGRTLEFWKEVIRKRANVSTYTLTITAIGDYRPDYVCSTKWASFEWRPIGV